MAEFTWDELVKGADTFEAPVEAGTYNVVVNNATYQESKKGDPQLVLVLEIQGGPHNGKSLWNYLTASSSSDFPRRNFVAGVRALLGEDATLDLEGDPETVAAPFFGKRAIVDVEIGDYEGRPSANIRRMKAVTGQVAPPQEPSGNMPPPQPLG